MKKIAVFLCVLLSCGIVYAAEEAAAQKRESQPIKISLAAGAGYTDNRDALPDKVSNIDLYIKLILALDLKWEEIALTLSYSPTYRYRTKPSIIDNDSQLLHDFSANLTLNPGRRVSLRLLENFNITDDPSVQQNGSTLRRDSSFVMNQTEVGMKYDISRLSNVDLMGRYFVRRYDLEERRLESDLLTTEAGLTLWGQPTGKRFGILGAVSAEMFNYEKYGGIDRSFDTLFMGGGLEQVFSKNFRCGLRGGWQNVAYKDNSLKSESSPFVNLSAQISTIPSTRITAAISRMIRDSFAFPFASQKMTDYSLRLDWDSPNPDLSLALSGIYRVGDYSMDSVSADFINTYQTDANLQQYVAASGLKSEGKEKTMMASFEISYKFGLGTTIKIVQSYEKVDSDVRWSFNRNATDLMLVRDF